MTDATLGQTEGQPGDAGQSPTPSAADELHAAEQEMKYDPLPPSGAPPSKTQTIRRSTGFFGMLVGGFIAAALGFGLARYVAPDGWPLASNEQLKTELAGQTGQLTTLAEAVKRLEAAAKTPAAENPELAARITALEAGLKSATDAMASVPDAADLNERVAMLETRLAGLGSTPVSGNGPAPAALNGLQSEIAALRSDIDAQKVTLAAEIEAATEASRAQLAEAQALKASAAVASALGRINTAIENGAPFAAVLVDLQAAGRTIPSGLLAVAERGAPTLRAVQDGFPEAARAALAASLRANAGESLTDRMTAFLRAQTGARSLTPREGADVDAVLSRMEAALQSGDVPLALTEAKGLPPEAKDAMADWTALAERRQLATQAVADLSAQLVQE